MSFQERFLDFQFNLGVNLSTGQQSTFAGGGTQDYVTGLRASATITKAGGISMGQASLAIYGLQLSTMQKLSTLGLNPLVIGPNFVTVLAYSGDGQPVVVFQGSITNAWFDGSNQPRVPFRVEAHAGLYEAIAPAPPSSYPGPVAASDVIASLASQMGRSFENDGVSTMLPAGTYFHGSARNQAYACAGAAGCNITLDDPGKVAIWPKGQARGSTVPLISPTTGMKNSPVFTSKGIEVDTLFNPNIGYGANVQVQSFLKPACGTWTVYGLVHNLQAQTPNGSWFTTVRAAPVGSVVSSSGVAPLPS